MKAFWQGLLQKFGENVAAQIWAVCGIAGPVVTWLTAPATYPINVKRWHLVAGVFALVLIVGATAWTTSHMRQRQKALLDDLERANKLLAVMKELDNGDDWFRLRMFRRNQLTDEDGDYLDIDDIMNYPAKLETLVAQPLQAGLFIPNEIYKHFGREILECAAATTIWATQNMEFYRYFERLAEAMKLEQGRQR